MTQRKKLIIALCIVFSIFSIIGYCIYVMIDIISGLPYLDSNVAFTSVENDIKAFLDENNFSYERNYTEDEDIKTAEYVITEGETSATLTAVKKTYCDIRLDITDTEKNFDQKIYTVLNLMNSLVGSNDCYNIENLTDDEYLYTKNDDITVYRRQLMKESIDYAKVILKHEYYSVYIIDGVSEKYYYI